MELVDATPRLWRELHARSDEATVFTSWDFHQHVQPEAKLLIAADAGTPAIGFWLTKTAFPFAKYQGILTAFRDPDCHGGERRQLHLVHQALLEVTRRYRSFTLALSPAFKHSVCLSWLSRQPSVKLTLTPGWSAVIDASRYINYDAYSDAVSQNRKRDARKAKQLILTDECDAVEMERLLRMTFARQGLAVMDSLSTLIERYWSFAGASGRANAAIYNGRIVAATLFLHDTRTGYYTMGGSHREPESAGASTILLMDQIRYCFTRQLNTIDLLGANDPTRARFKLSFAATPFQ